MPLFFVFTHVCVSGGVWDLDSASWASLDSRVFWDSRASWVSWTSADKERLRLPTPELLQPASLKHAVQRSSESEQGSMKAMQVGAMRGMFHPTQAHWTPRQGGGSDGQASEISPILMTRIWMKKRTTLGCFFSVLSKAGICDARFA